MQDEASLDREAAKIAETLLTGENVIFVGPNRELIRRLVAASTAQLEKSTQVLRWSGQGPLENLSHRGTHLVAETISPKQALQILTGHSQFTLLASVDAAHQFGVAFMWAKVLQEEFGDKSVFLDTLLSQALKTIRCVGVSNSSAPQIAGGTFREKLLTARYNQKKSVVADHGSLLKGWTREGDACDPGWELDK